MTTPILTPGDILLHHRNGIVSDLIRAIDGSEYSHVSLVRDDNTVIEVNPYGIGTTSLDAAVMASDFTDAFRLRTSPISLSPILGRGEYYVGVGDRFAYEPLLLLGFLFTTRRVPLPRVTRFLLRKVLDASASLMSRIVEGRREPIVCSQMVYRCFDEAPPTAADEYSVTIGTYSSNVVITPTGIMAAYGTGRRGIDSDSLVSVVARRRHVLGFVPQTQIHLSPLAELPTDLLIQDFAEEGADYLQALAAGPGRDWLSCNDLATDPEVVARLDRLVTLGATAVINRDQSMPSPLQLAWDYSAFSGVVADFVTPKDLSSSPSLINVGRRNGA